jgi:rubrerythrin
MNEKEVIERLGPREEIARAEHRMLSLIWVCGTCQYIVASPVLIPAPAPCPYCGGIAFKAVRAEPR